MDSEREYDGVKLSLDESLGDGDSVAESLGDTEALDDGESLGLSDGVTDGVSVGGHASSLAVITSP